MFIESETVAYLVTSVPKILFPKIIHFDWPHLIFDKSRSKFNSVRRIAILMTDIQVITLPSSLLMQ